MLGCQDPRSVHGDDRNGQELSWWWVDQVDQVDQVDRVDQGWTGMDFSLPSMYEVITSSFCRYII